MAKLQLSEVLETLREKWPCCQFGSVPIQILPDREKGFFDSFMPQAVSAIAVGHHVVTEKEWTWYQPLQGHERCDADDHTFEVCIELVKTLDNQEVETRIVDYPGESGLQFRYVAEAASLGRIGNNAFLLHPKWGPWIHLRILATAVQIESNPCSEGIQEPICCD